VAEQIITEVKAILSAQDKDFTSTFQNASAQMHSFNKTAATIGAVTAGVGFALIKLGKAAFADAARVQELDVAMQAIGRSTGIGYEAINKASNGIRKMGIELAASQQIAIEFAQNNLEIAKAADVAAPLDMGISVSAKELTKLKRALPSSADNSYARVYAKKQRT
jgi:hypothetical protein